MSKKKNKKSKTRKTKLKNKKGTQVVVKQIVQAPPEKKPSGIWSLLRKLASAFLP